MTKISSIDVPTRDIVFSDRMSEPAERLVFRGQFAAVFAVAAAAIVLAVLSVFNG